MKKNLNIAYRRILAQVNKSSLECELLMIALIRGSCQLGQGVNQQVAGMQIV
jgi:hypothetical protein